jgi:hypothetical protein
VFTITDPIEYLSVSTRENLLHPKLQGVGPGFQFLLYSEVNINVKVDAAMDVGSPCDTIIL